MRRRTKGARNAVLAGTKPCRPRCKGSYTDGTGGAEIADKQRRQSAAAQSVRQGPHRVGETAGTADKEGQTTTTVPIG